MPITPPTTWEMDPCTGQSERTIGPFLKRCVIGDNVAVRCTAHGILKIMLTRIHAIRPEFGRLYTDQTLGAYGGA